MDVLDYKAIFNPQKGNAELTVQKIQGIEMMNHGFYYRPSERDLISVPYSDMGQVLRFTKDWTFHIYLFRKDAAYVKAAFRKFLKLNSLDELAENMAKKSFKEIEAKDEVAFEKELRDQIKKDDRSKLIHGSSENK